MPMKTSLTRFIYMHSLGESKHAYKKGFNFIKMYASKSTNGKEKTFISSLANLHLQSNMKIKMNFNIM